MPTELVQMGWAAIGLVAVCIAGMLLMRWQDGMHIIGLFADAMKGVIGTNAVNATDKATESNNTNVELVATMKSLKEEVTKLASKS